MATSDPLPPNVTIDMSRAVRQDVVDSTLTYLGYAIPGVTSTQSGWQIQRITSTGGNVSDVKWASGDNYTNKVWDSGVSKAITAITVANPGVVTATAHGFVTGSQVIIRNVAGMTQVNGHQYTITVIGANTFSIVDTTAYTAYTSGGTAAQPEYANAYTYS